MNWKTAARQLADGVAAHWPEWHDAVCGTPRHQLVTQWWERIPQSPAEEWGLVVPAPLSAGHLAAAFRDQTLVTRVGPDHADHAKPGDTATGNPTSSSTLPGLVVSMIGRLGAKPGEDVLDVGTGSGYSAALLAHRLGDEHVTSLDVDEYLVRAARARLAEFGRTPRMEAIDATGELSGSGYDRIVATVSVRPVPKSWLRALRPGGRLVTTIAHTALLITADMGDDGVARGRVEADPASFMETRREADYPPRLHHVFTHAREDDGDDIRAAEQPVPDLWSEWPLRWLYELETPGVETRAATHSDGRRVVWLLAADGSWARAEDGPAPVIHQSGSRRLWDALEDVRRRWEAAGRFPLHRLSVTLTPDGGTLTAPDGWTFTL